MTSATDNKFEYVYISRLDKKSYSCETLNKGSTESAQTDNPKEILKNLRLKNVNRLICAQLNINSIRNKFDSLVNVINNNIDILMISEAKLDPSFPTGKKVGPLLLT